MLLPFVPKILQLGLCGKICVSCYFLFNFKSLKSFDMKTIYAIMKEIGRL